MRGIPPRHQRTVNMKKLTSTQETLNAAMISRRSLLKASAALGAVGFAGPLYVKNAFSSSGELNYMGWAGYALQRCSRRSPPPPASR